MAAICQVTGAVPGFGHSISHSHRRNNPDRMVLKKYDPVVRKHVDFREER